LLQKSYANKIKMIYIDPPYNTGKDFVYKDNYADNLGNYLNITGQTDEEGKKISTNTESDGRYHSNWLNMMYPRLRLARNIMKDDGVIFISIDDNEVHNLRKLCDEIFGEDNFVCEFIVNSNSTKNNAKLVSVSHEYILCFGKNKNNITDEWEIEKNYVDEFLKRANQLLKKGLTNDEMHLELLELVKYPRFYDLDHYTFVDKRGVYQTDNPGGVTNGNTETVVIHPITGKVCTMPNGGWRYKDDEIKRLIENELFEFGIDETIIPRPKRYLNDYKNQIPKSSMFYDSQSSTKWLKSQKIPFEFSKSIDLLRHLIKMIKSSDYVLDFFAGSGTTAHAVMKLNAEDGGNRKCISVQLPEPTVEKSEAFKAGYATIAEITKERIRRAGEKIKNDYKDNKEVIDKLDVGFKAFRLDSSNIVAWDGNPDNLAKQLDAFANNIKTDRTEEDILFEILLKYGLDLTVAIDEKTIAAQKVFSVGQGTLFICLSNAISPAVSEGIGAWKQELNPTICRVIFKDTGFQSDKDKTNAIQILKRFGIEEVNSI